MMQEFVQEVLNLVDKKIREMHTAFPGKIVSFDPETGLAAVLPVMKYKKPDGTTVDYPQISGVPVVFPQGMGGKATIAYPVTAGDTCMVIVSEQAIDYFLYDQETETDLAFDMTNAICIPGLFNKANSVMAEACEKNAVIMDVKGSRVVVGEDAVEIAAPNVKITGNVTVNGMAI